MPARARCLTIFTAAVFTMAGFALSILAQSPPGFEVASIRPAVNDGRGTSFDMCEGRRLRVSSVTLYGLIKSAWMLQSSQVAGPAWLDGDRYDIDAKSGRPERIDTDHLQPLLQSLLAERFALKFHWETWELPVYALAVDKSGAILKENRDAPITILNTPGDRERSGSWERRYRWRNSPAPSEPNWVGW
jgi:uncharacterized protein (TIGR03435 family)